MNKSTISDGFNNKSQGLEEKLEPKYDKPELVYEMHDPLGIGDTVRRNEAEKFQAELWMSNYQQRPKLDQQDPNINLSDEFNKNAENINAQQENNESVSTSSFMNELSEEFQKKVADYKLDNSEISSEKESNQQDYGSTDL
ncbi:MAG: hypothetical protein GQ532_14305 [Methylomarinum sp.]|nr:hypothetical protein [Methylomarinum sp.]